MEGRCRDKQQRGENGVIAAAVNNREGTVRCDGDCNGSDTRRVRGWNNDNENDLLYYMYTSGTTDAGQLKAVVQTHQGLLNHI